MLLDSVTGSQTSLYKESASKQKKVPPQPAIKKWNLVIPKENRDKA